jgi:phospholipase/lecithinase/hemolysin
MGFPRQILLHFLVVLAASITSHTAAADAPCTFPAIFNFGDSNSDTGGLSALFGQAPPPAGETYFRKPAGRYSDGRLIIDFIAQRLGLPYLRAYLDAVGSNFTHGANFATSGSTIRPQNTTFLQSGYSPVSLDFQFNQFYDFRRRSVVARAEGIITVTVLKILVQIRFMRRSFPKKKYSPRLYTLSISVRTT